MTKANQDPRKVKPLLVLGLLFVVFMGPMLFAWGMYKRADNVSFNYMNHGELVLPPVPVEDLHLTDLRDHQAYPMTKIAGKWSVAYLLPDICSEYCHQNLYNIRQVHTALGKDANRVQRMVWFLPHQNNQVNSFIDETYPDVAQTTLYEDSFKLYLDPLVDSTERVEMGAFYIIDPVGNIMMAYAGDMPPKSIMKDLKRLLKVSQIG